MNPFFPELILFAVITTAVLYLTVCAWHKHGSEGRNVRGVKRPALYLAVGTLLTAQTGFFAWAAAYTSVWAMPAGVAAAVLAPFAGWAAGYANYRRSWQKLEAEVFELVGTHT